MKRSLVHLPQYKKDELKVIVQIIRKIAQVEMIILFGSHCGNHWVEKDCYVEDNTIYSKSTGNDLSAL